MEQHGFAVQLETGSFTVILGQGEETADQGNLSRSGNDAGDMIRVGYRLQGLMGMQQADQEEKGESREGTQSRFEAQGKDNQGQEHEGNEREQRLLGEWLREAVGCAGPGDKADGDADKQVFGTAANHPVHVVLLCHGFSSKEGFDGFQVSMDNAPIGIDVRPGSRFHRPTQDRIGQNPAENGF